MLIGVLSILVDAYLVREARRFVTIGGKGAMNRPARLGAWRWPATGLAAAAFALSVGLPLVTLFLSTVMRVPADFLGRTSRSTTGSAGTCPRWRCGRASCSARTVARGLQHAWIVGLASLCSGILGIVVGYVVVAHAGAAAGHVPAPGDVHALPRAGHRLRSRLPVAVRGGAGADPALYGTSLILILALVAVQMPYASRAGISAMMQLGKDPEEAAQVVGAGWLTRIRLIVVPIQKGSLMTGILLPFISGIKG